MSGEESGFLDSIETSLIPWIVYYQGGRFNISKSSKCKQISGALLKTTHLMITADRSMRELCPR